MNNRRRSNSPPPSPLSQQVAALGVGGVESLGQSSRRHLGRLNRRLLLESSKRIQIGGARRSNLRSIIGDRGVSLHSIWPLLALSVVALVFVMVAVESLLHASADPVGCQMTYMRPRYLAITDFGPDKTRFGRKYGLYLYREALLDGDMELEGQPVLFIPGNAGSYKQVRSLAAETAKMRASHSGGGVTFDFFTVDFNEEFSGLHGATLREQAEYINEVIRYLLMDLYPLSHSMPASVIIVGHSMGGAVARLLPTLANYWPWSVEVIFTLATPHLSPPASLDYQLWDSYRSISTYWRAAFDSPGREYSALRNVSLVSIAGGNLDRMVSSFLMHLDDVVPDTNAISAFTTGISDVWVGSDHQCMVWCNQLVRKLSLILYNIVKPGSPPVLLPLDERMKVIRRQLQPSMVFGKDIDNDKLSSSGLYLSGVDSLPFSLKSLVRISVGELVYAGASRLNLYTVPHSNVSFHLCSPSIPCRRIPSLLEKLPVYQYSPASHRVVHMHSIEIANVASEYYFQISSSAEAVLDMVSTANDVLVDRSFTYISLSGINLDLHNKPPQTNKRIIIRLPYAGLVSYHLTLDTDSCSPGSLFPALVKQTTILGEVKYWTEPSRVKLNFFSRSMYHSEYVSRERDELVLDVFSTPSCLASHIYISVDWMGSLANFLRRYMGAGLNVTVALLLVVFACQLQICLKAGIFPGILPTLSQLILGRRNFFMILSTVLVLVSIDLIFSERPIEGLTGIQDFWLIFPTMIIVATGLLTIISALLFGLCILLATVRVVLVKDDNSNSSEILPPPVHKPSSVMGRKLMVIVCFTLMILTYFPSQLAFVVSIFAHLLNVARALTGYDDPSVLNFQFTILIFLILNLPFHVPALMAWMRNLSVFWISHADHDIFTSIPFLILVTIILTSPEECIDQLRGNKMRTKGIIWAFRIGAVLAFVFGLRMAWICLSISNCLVVIMMLGMTSTADILETLQLASKQKNR